MLQKCPAEDDGSVEYAATKVSLCQRFNLMDVPQNRWQAERRERSRAATHTHTHETGELDCYSFITIYTLILYLIEVYLHDYDKSRVPVITLT